MQRRPFFVACLIAAILAVLIGILVMSRRQAPMPVVASARPSPSAAPPAPAKGTPEPATPAAEVSPAAEAPAGERAPSLRKFNGTVYDERTRSPIAGAVVGVFGANLSDSPCEEPAPRASATTDGDGRYTLEFSRDATAQLEVIVARREGFADSGRLTRTFSPEGGGADIAGDGFDIGMARGDDLRVKVVADADDSPIVGAKVVLQGATGQMNARSMEKMVLKASRSVTGSAGTCTVPTGGPISVARLTACATGYINASATLMQPDLSQEVVIRMVPCGAGIEGVVLDLEGGPVADVRVSARAEWRPGQEFLMLGTRTNAEGRYSLPCLPAGKLSVTASLTPERSFGDEVEVTLEKGETRTVDFREQPMGFATVAGKVTHRDTGKGVADVELFADGSFGMASNPGPGDFGYAHTKPDGTYQMKVRAGAKPAQNSMTILRLEAPKGFVMVARGARGMGPGRFLRDLRAGSTHEENFELAPALTVRGIAVADATGEPVAGAQALYLGMGPGRRGNPRTATSDEQGRIEFQVEEIVEGQLHANTETASGSAEVPADFGPDSPPIEVRLQDGATVSGRLVDTEGKPVGGVSVTARADETRGVGGRTPMFGFGLPRNVATGADGAFTLRGVPPGRVILDGADMRGMMRGRQNAKTRGTVEPLRLELSPGESREGVTLIFAAGFCIKGIVVDEDGQPIESVMVNAISGDQYQGTVMRIPSFTGKDGRFEVCGLPLDATVQLNAWKEGYENVSAMGLTSLAGEQTLRMKKDHSLTLIVVREGTREPVKSIEWRATQSGSGGPGWGRVGRGSRDSSPSGTYQVSLRMPEGEERILQVAELDADGKGTGFAGSTSVGPNDSEVTVTVAKLVRSIRGRAVTAGEGGKPVAGATVSVATGARQGWWDGEPGSGFDVAPVQSDAAGNFVVRGVAPGSYTISARKGELSSAKLEVVVSAEADPAPVTVELAAPGRLFGKVTGPDGAVIAGAKVDLRMMNLGNDEPRSATTDAGGRYEIAGVGPFEGGHMMVTVPESKLRKGTGCSLKPGEEKEINFDFTGQVRLRGRITINGEPPPARRVVELRDSLDNSVGDLRGIDPSGNYDVYVPAGELHVALSTSGTILEDAVAPFTLAATPLEQTRNLDITVFPAAVAIVLPEGGTMPPGLVLSIRIEPPGEPATMVHVGPATQTEIAIPLVRAGMGQAVVTRVGGGQGEWKSESMALAPGGENLLVVPITE